MAPIVLLAPPSLAIVVINRQKSFLDYNITPTVPGTVFYHFQKGANIPAMTLTDIQISLKNNIYTIESMEDFQNQLYTQ